MRRGFTLMELAICLSIAALLLPLLFLHGRNISESHERALFQSEATAALRTVSEELRRDAHGHRLAAQGPVRFEGHGCTIDYVVRDRVLSREATDACGGRRALAREVVELERAPHGLVLRLSRPLRPDLSADFSGLIAEVAP